MTKVSVVLYYWILVAATLLFARTAGLADKDSAIIKILIVVTILYAGVVMISLSTGKPKVESQRKESQKGSANSSGDKKKKRK